MEKLVKPVIPQKKIQAWLMSFASADLSDKSQKQRIIDIFVNSVYVYDDRVVIFFNYKDGERCVDFSVLSDSENPEGAISSNKKRRTPTRMSVRLRLSLVTRTGIESLSVLFVSFC